MWGLVGGPKFWYYLVVDDCLGGDRVESEPGAIDIKYVFFLVVLCVFFV